MYILLISFYLMLIDFNKKIIGYLTLLVTTYIHKYKIIKYIHKVFSLLECTQPKHTYNLNANV